MVMKTARVLSIALLLSFGAAHSMDLARNGHRALTSHVGATIDRAHGLTARAIALPASAVVGSEKATSLGGSAATTLLALGTLVAAREAVAYGLSYVPAATEESYRVTKLAACLRSRVLGLIGKGADVQVERLAEATTAANAAAERLERAVAALAEANKTEEAGE